MYPVLLDIGGKSCVVIGGGGVAERKVNGLLASGGAVRVVSPEVTAGLAGLARQGTIDWRQKLYTDDDLDGAVLVFAATNSREAQKMICRQAKANGQLLNVADDPDSCSFHVPATVRRGDLILAVSTSGKSPAVAAHIRRQLEMEFGPEYETLLQLMAWVRLRTGSDAEKFSQQDRKKIYKKILHNDIIDWIRTGKVDTLRDHLQKILGPDVELDVNLPKMDT